MPEHKMSDKKRDIVDVQDTQQDHRPEPGEEDLPVLERRAYGLLDEGRYEEAGPLFKEMAERAPADRAGHAGLAWTAEFQWKWKEAIYHWNQCIAIAGPYRDEAIVRKAHCLAEIGSIREASDLLRSVSHRMDAMEALARLAESQEPHEVARRAWEECITRFPDRLEGHLGKARLLMGREAYAEADTLLSDILQRWPDCVLAAALRAQCAVAVKNWQEAAQRWASVMAMQGQTRAVRMGYSRYLAALGDRSAAVIDLAKVAQQPVALTECLLEYHLARDDFGAASEQAGQLVELDRERPEHRFRQAAILVRSGSASALHAALWILTNLHQRCPDSVSIKILLIEALMAAGSAEKATGLIGTVPREDKRRGIEIARAWRMHTIGSEAAAKEYWTRILAQSYTPAVHARVGELNRVDHRNNEIGRDDILLFSVLRNEMPRLEWFLGYYRKLGINKFIIVDNASTDGTSEFLSQQADVILYQTADQYSLSGSGMRWINSLIEQHGSNNWCVHVDADEALVFPGCEDAGLRGLTKYLSEQGYEAMRASMLDMYPSSIPKDMSDIGRLQAAYCYFDNDLHIQDHLVCPYREIYGGARRRLFEGYQLLNKVPLLLGNAGIKFLLSSHRITPAKIADVSGALLHYHLIYLLQPEYRGVLTDAIEHRQFPSNSLERLRSRDLLPKVYSAESLLCEDSVRFQSAQQLVELGIMTPPTGVPAAKPTDVLRGLAESAEAASDWEGAAAFYQEIATRPDCTFWDHYYRARALLYDDRFDEAAAQIARLSLPAEQEGACTILSAELLERTGQHQLADKLWSEALEKGGSPYWCLFGKARVRARLGQIRQARELMEKALLLEDAEKRGLTFTLEMDLAACDLVQAAQRQAVLNIDPEAARLQILAALPGMTSMDERLATYEAAANIDVQGDIVDLGCGVGSLTAAMATGLRTQPGDRQKRTKIYAIDRFEWDSSYMECVWRDAFPGQKPQAGESFLPLFHYLIKPWSDSVEVLSSDINYLDWDTPISLLSVDAMKDLWLSKRIISSFIPKLVPGGLLFHQDYCLPATWWIHVYNYLLRHRFEVAKVLPGSSGVLFRLISPITSDDVTNTLAHDLTDRATAEQAFAYSLQLLPVENRAEIHRARKEYYRYLGQLSIKQSPTETP